jgi:hypothetical protein
MSVPVIDRIAEALGTPPLVVMLHCLKHRYPALRRANSKIGSLVEQLVTELSKPARTTPKA